MVGEWSQESKDLLSSFWQVLKEISVSLLKYVLAPCRTILWIIFRPLEGCRLRHNEVVSCGLWSIERDCAFVSSDWVKTLVFVDYWRQGNETWRYQNEVWVKRRWFDTRGAVSWCHRILNQGMLNPITCTRIQRYLHIDTARVSLNSPFSQHVSQ